MLLSGCGAVRISAWTQSQNNDQMGHQSGEPELAEQVEMIPGVAHLLDKPQPTVQRCEHHGVSVSYTHLTLPTMS
mgnify:CR=1 FL=1